jgi:aminopeptidase Y
MTRNITRAFIAVAIFAASLVFAPTASVQTDSCSTRTNNTFRKLAECTTVAGAGEHRAAFQQIADENNGHRVAGSTGDAESLAYAADVLQRAGYNVTVQEFSFPSFYNITQPLLQQIAPSQLTLDNIVLTNSASGDVTAPVSIPSGDLRGCYAADFAGFPAGNIALVQRGAPVGFPTACTFALKAANAAAAGASGLVIYNNIAGPLNGTLGEDNTVQIPVTSVTMDLGQQLAATPGLVMRVQVNSFRGVATSSNILAESVSGDPNNVVMAGAHIDSVNAGPGGNDNASGAAALLEVAENLAKLKTTNKVRFAFWGAHERGLIGSNFYVSNLSQEDQDRISMYIDFMMLASPNYVFHVMDGDFSEGEGLPFPAGSGAIEQAFNDYYSLSGQQTIPAVSVSTSSDWGPFVQAGIPSGGIYAGSIGIKTAEEASIWGGTAGIAYDPCYHLACDTYANFNETAYDVNLDAAAYVLMKFAYKL